MLEPYPPFLSRLTRWLVWLALGVSYCVAVEIAHADVLVGKASYYTVQSCQKEGTSGVYTASGEPYNETDFTAALPSHDFGALYRVCLADGQHIASPHRSRSHCVMVRHNDYGPGRGPRRNGVVIDLTPKAFAQLAPLSQGVVRVSVERVK